MKDRGIFIIILCSLVIFLTLANLGLYASIRLISKQQQQRITQINQQVVNRDRQVQQFIGQLKASKTIGEVKEVLEKVQ